MPLPWSFKANWSCRSTPYRQQANERGYGFGDESDRALTKKLLAGMKGRKAIPRSSEATRAASEAVDHMYAEYEAEKHPPFLQRGGAHGLVSGGNGSSHGRGRSPTNWGGAGGASGTGHTTRDTRRGLGPIGKPGLQESTSSYTPRDPLRDVSDSPDGCSSTSSMSLSPPLKTAAGTSVVARATAAAGGVGELRRAYSSAHCASRSTPPAIAAFIRAATHEERRDRVPKPPSGIDRGDRRDRSRSYTPASDGTWCGRVLHVEPAHWWRHHVIVGRGIVSKYRVRYMRRKARVSSLMLLNCDGYVCEVCRL